MNKLMIVLAIGAVVAAFSFANSLQHQHGAAKKDEMQGCGSCAPGAKQDAEVFKAQDVKGVQKATVTVDAGKYAPASIQVQKDKPVELAFKAGANPGCGSTLVIKDLKVKRDLQPGKAEIVKFTPKKAGTIDFTCGMGMLRGKIVVK